MVVGHGFGDDVEIHFARICRRGERREDFERSYFTQTHWRDERLPRLRVLPDSKVVLVTELFSEEELKTSVVYNERLPLSGSQNGLNVRLDGPDGSRIVWTVSDSGGRRRLDILAAGDVPEPVAAYPSVCSNPPGAVLCRSTGRFPV